MAAVESVSLSRHHGGFLDDQQLQFPDGLRVLVVDDDVTCLTILNHMLKRCRYQVTTCCQATVALSLLRQRKGGFDVMISDVHMPDMDGYKLLEIVGLEMDLPVIMISADGRTSAVMKGIQHGACDYLIKPVRIEELQNIWQHVVRKKWRESKEVEHSGSFEDSTCCLEVVDEPEANASSTNEIRDDNRIYRKNKRDAKEDEELGHDSDASKKPRVAWSVELHQQFVNAVNKLGVDKAVPKKVLDLMNVPGLSRENVASHLQKFRLYLKRISSTSQHQNKPSNILFPPQKANKEREFLDGYSFEAFGNSDQISSQTLAALNIDIVNKSSGDIVLPASSVMPQPFPPTQRSVDKHNAQEVAYGLPILKCQPFNSGDFHVRTNVSLLENSCFSTGPSKQHSIKGSTDIIEAVKNDQNCNLLRQMLQQQGQYASLQEPNHTFSVQPSGTIVYQPSMLFPNMPFPAPENPAVISSQSSIGFGETKLFSTIQYFNNNNNLQYPDYSTPACVSNDILSSVHQLQGQALLTGGLSSTNMRLRSISPSVPWSSTDTDSANILPSYNPPLEVDLSQSVPASNIICNQRIENKRLTIPVKRHGENLGFVGQGTCISSLFALDDTEYPT